MIYYSIPFNRDKNVGQYYNAFMNMLPNESDYACFIDGDAMFLHPFFGNQLEDIVREYADFGVFTCMTNRIGCRWQLTGDQNSDNIREHRNFADTLAKHYYSDVSDVTNKPHGEVLSGVLILIRKSDWIKIGGFKEEGMLGVDNQLHWDCKRHGVSVGLMNGVYVYHWYRGGLNGNKQHLL